MPTVLHIRRLHPRRTLARPASALPSYFGTPVQSAGGRATLVGAAAIDGEKPGGAELRRDPP